MRVIKGTPKHLSKNGKLNKFTYLMLNFPFRCNFRCLKCFNIGNLKLDNASLITTNDRIKLIKEAKKLGCRVVVIAGEGEPSLDKDIKKLIKIINSLYLTAIIYTNGSTLTKDLIEFYRSNNVNIVISLDSLIPERYNKLTNTRGQLKKVLENINLVRNIYQKTKKISKDLTIFRVAINTTVSSVNKDEILGIKKFCGDDIYFICNPLAKLGSAVKKWSDLIKNEKDYKDVLKLAKRLSEAGGPLTMGTDGLCGYSRWGIAVSPRGDYMTCAYTNLTDGLLGNIRDRKLKDAFRFKHRLEAEHYRKYGSAPCLVRMPSFTEYIKKLQNLT